jgi:hypothetical protein
MSIEPLNPRNAADVNSVAELHEEFLGNSPVVKMGRDFMRKFYYVKLVEDRLVLCSICRAEDGRVAGFLSYTPYASSMLSMGVKKHFIALSWLMLKSVIARPGLVKDILFVLGIMRQRAQESGSTTAPNTGEAISMAVRPEYQGYVPAGGKARVAVRLFQKMVDDLRAEGTERIIFVVEPKNLSSNLFHRSMGCSMEPATHAGVPVHLYTYDMNETQ